jgi:tetratricopeptide (TPR) repeat protein
VTGQNDSVRITLHLIDVALDTDEWTGRFEGDLSDLLSLEDAIASDVARQLRAHLTPREDSLLATSHRIDPRAGEAYLRARTTTDRNEATELLEQAIRLDPGFAAPYGELARRYGEMAFGGGSADLRPEELYDRVVRLADRGLQLDSTLASAYTALAEVKFHRDWDWEAGLRLFQRAQDMNPSYGLAYMRISGHQAAMGRLDESVAAARIAQTVDPRSTFAWSGLALNLCRLGLFEDALAEVEVALRMEPGQPYALAKRGMALAHLGRFEEGLADLRLSGDSVELAIALALAGRNAEAVALRDALADPSRAQRTPPFELARVFAVTGDEDRAVTLIELAEAERAGSLMYLNVDPDLESVRDDPSVRDLLSRMRFPSR